MTTNKIVIVTGGSRGIGAETARLFARNGYDVCINYLRNDEAAEKVRSEILDIGRRCIAVRADVSIGSEVVDLFNTVDKELGILSVLVNNAAILMTQSRLVDITEDRFSEVLRKM